MGAAAARWAAAERGRLYLWAPVAIGVGVGVYFGLRAEPHWSVSAWWMGLAVALAVAAPLARKPAIAVALAGLGFAAADWRTETVSAPQLSRETGIIEIAGRLLAVEESAAQRRMVIALARAEGLDPARMPARVRVVWRGAVFDAAPGDFITLRAGLRPPPPPALPGGFDFARQLYFRGIGAVGFAVSPPAVDRAAPKTRRQRIAAHVEMMRVSLARRILDAAPGDGGAIVAAVVTGKREAISYRAEAALRDSGLAHLLAISGLHMGLAAGLIFFCVRLGLALIEPLALRFPIKKWAAAAALASGVFYLVLSGGGWSARRAFIMTAIMLVAILIDRRALSLRNVAAAAIVILLTTPEALFQPGFQMSFAAVAALIAAYEAWRDRDRGAPEQERRFTMAGRAKRYAAGLAATDLIAALATAPYALYHFNRAAVYSLPANIAAMPLMGFWIMPAAVAGLCLAPFGADVPAWRAAAAGMEVVLAIATEVSGWRGAVSVTPQWPLGALLVLTLGGLWLCLARAPWRLGGLAAVPLAATLTAGAPPADIYVAASGDNAGVVTRGVMGAALAEAPRLDGPGAAVAVYSTRRNAFAAAMWTEAAGLDPMRAPPEAMADRFSCDGSGCAGALPRGVVFSVIEARAALAEDCARADLVIAFFPVDEAARRACKADLIDRRAVWRRGAHAVSIDEEGALTIRNAMEFRGQRPWTRN